jgi:hypothetical protein
VADEHYRPNSTGTSIQADTGAPRRSAGL